MIDIEKRLDRFFVLLLVISLVFLLFGFIVGGIFVIIFGIGFFEEEDKVIVFIGGYICYVESLLFIEIICIFSVYIVGSKDVEVIVIIVIGLEIMVVCKYISGLCIFLYFFIVILEVINVIFDVIIGIIETILILMGLNLKLMVEGAIVVVGG